MPFRIAIGTTEPRSITNVRKFLKCRLLSTPLGENLPPKRHGLVELSKAREAISKRKIE